MATKVTKETKPKKPKAIKVKEKQIAESIQQEPSNKLPESTQFTIYTGKPTLFDKIVLELIESTNELVADIDIGYNNLIIISNKLDNFLRESFFKDDKDFNRTIVNIDIEKGLYVYGFSFNKEVHKLEEHHSRIQVSVRTLFNILINKDKYFFISMAPGQLYHTEYEVFVSAVIAFAKYSKCKVYISTDSLEFLKVFETIRCSLVESEWSLIQLKFKNGIHSFDLEDINQFRLTGEEFLYAIENNLEVR